MAKLFTELSVCNELLDGILDLGFKEMTPIQEAAIPIILAGNDLIGAAQTGTGKTAAFLIPIIDRLARLERGTIRALVLTPTRELAMQIDEQMTGLAYHTGLSSTSIIGGTNFGPQERALRKKVDMVIATPGRLLDHLRHSYVDLNAVQILVLDEADRMLDMGFLPDVQNIIDKLPQQRQTVLFSATISPKVKALAGRFMRHPKEVQIGRLVPVEAIRQRFIAVSQEGKQPLLLRLLKEEGMDSVLVFARTRQEVRRLTRNLQQRGISCDSLHSGRTQEDRNKALERFHRREVPILVATDIASRGLDISDVSHVINYDIPQDPDDYIHRIGRTARAKKEGDAITFVAPADAKILQEISKALHAPVKLENAVGEIVQMPNMPNTIERRKRPRRRGRSRR